MGYGLGSFVWQLDRFLAHKTATLTNAYAVSNFRVRFYFHSDSSIVYDGWYLDDVAAGTSAPTACEP